MLFRATILAALAAVVHSQVEIVLGPVEGSGFVSAQIEGGPYYMYVTSPTTTDAECRPDEYDATESVCSGAFNLDLSTNDVISVSFKAPEGEELEISAAEKVRFEFQATVENHCGEFQEFSGSDVTVSLIGSDTSGLVVANESFLTLGQ